MSHLQVGLNSLNYRYSGTLMSFQNSVSSGLDNVAFHNKSAGLYAGDSTEGNLLASSSFEIGAESAGSGAKTCSDLMLSISNQFNETKSFIDTMANTPLDENHGSTTSDSNEKKKENLKFQPAQSEKNQKMLEEQQIQQNPFKQQEIFEQNQAFKFGGSPGRDPKWETRWLPASGADNPFVENKEAKEKKIDAQIQAVRDEQKYRPQHNPEHRTNNRGENRGERGEHRGEHRGPQRGNHRGPHRNHHSDEAREHHRNHHAHRHHNSERVQEKVQVKEKVKTKKKAAGKKGEKGDSKTETKTVTKTKIETKAKQKAETQSKPKPENKPKSFFDKAKDTLSNWTNKIKDWLTPDKKTEPAQSSNSGSLKDTVNKVGSSLGDKVKDLLDKKDNTAKEKKDPLELNKDKDKLNNNNNLNNNPQNKPDQPQNNNNNANNNNTNSSNAQNSGGKSTPQKVKVDSGSAGKEGGIKNGTSTVAADGNNQTKKVRMVDNAEKHRQMLQEADEARKLNDDVLNNLSEFYSNAVKNFKNMKLYSETQATLTKNMYEQLRNKRLDVQNDPDKSKLEKDDMSKKLFLQSMGQPALFSYAS